MKLTFKNLFGLLVFITSCNPNAILHKPNLTAMSIPNSDVEASKVSIFSIKLKTLVGEETTLEKYKGKKIIILNTASECGYTPQYAKWEKFYEDNKATAVVLGFPANNFGGQEPGTNSEIKSFCTKNYGVTFPMFEKISVKGADKSPLYKWLTDSSLNGWNTAEPTWNFCKYLINEKGELTEFFASKIEPTNEEFLKAFNKK